MIPGFRITASQFGLGGYIILEGCAQTAAVGDPVELVGLLFFLFSFGFLVILP
jgi:hypothetical protein